MREGEKLGFVVEVKETKDPSKRTVKGYDALLSMADTALDSAMNSGKNTCARYQGDA